MGEVTIDSIQIEIESNSTNAAKGLDALAGSLEKLKQNGSFKTISNNLNNLSAALKSVSGINLDRVAPQIQKFADTVAPCQILRRAASILPLALCMFQWIYSLNYPNTISVLLMN